MISLRRSSPYFLLIAASSSEMISILRSRLSRIPLSSSMVTRKAASSSSSFSISSPVSRASRMSRIALACRSDSSKDSRNRSDAISASREPLIILITSSMLSTATLRPSRMCARSSAFLRSKVVRRTTTA